jgi:lycopene beta-cyclase
MNYADLLILFVTVPIVLLAAVAMRDFRAHKWLPPLLRGWSPLLVLPVLILIAVLYTTPWDSHLISARVWWYGARRITGITLDEVPVEELSFFVLQGLLVGLWFVVLAGRIRTISPEAIGAARSATLRWRSAAVGSLLWVISVAVLLSGWRPGTYLGWELAWALPPLILQLWIGADILWQHRLLICATLVPIVLYLSAVDTLAIRERIWTVNEHLSLNLLLGGQLPLEEFLFFALTSALVTFGLLLGIAMESKGRLPAILQAESRQQASGSRKTTHLK